MIKSLTDSLNNENIDKNINLIIKKYRNQHFLIRFLNRILIIHWIDPNFFFDIWEDVIRNGLNARQGPGLGPVAETSIFTFHKMEKCVKRHIRPLSADIKTDTYLIDFSCISYRTWCNRSYKTWTFDKSWYLHMLVIETHFFMWIMYSDRKSTTFCYSTRCNNIFMFVFHLQRISGINRRTFIINIRRVKYSVTLKFLLYFFIVVDPVY